MNIYQERGTESVCKCVYVYSDDPFEMELLGTPDLEPLL